MSTLAKIVIGTAALLLVLGVGGAILTAGSLGFFAARTVQADPAGVNAAAARIADFSLPPGYSPEATAEIAGYLFVSYAPGDGHSHIQFVQAPADVHVDQATLEGYIQQAPGSRGYDTGARSQVVGSQRATIRGLTVMLVVGEAIDHDGQPFRTLTGVFDGKGGPALLSVESPISSWNQEEGVWQKTCSSARR